MDGYQGFVPFVWKRIRQYRFRNTYQLMNKRYYPGRKRKAVVRSTRMGKRSWGLKLPKSRICLVSPVSLLKDVYMRMVMTLTGKKNSSRLAYGNYTCALTKSSRKRVEATTTTGETSSVIYLNYLLKEGSLSSASGYTKWLCLYEIATFKSIMDDREGAENGLKEITDRATGRI